MYRRAVEYFITLFTGEPSVWLTARERRRWRGGSLVW